MGKTVTKIAIGAAIIGLAVATGGISLAPTLASAGVGGIGAFAVAGGLSTTFLGGLALSFGASTILGGVAGAFAKKPRISPAQVDRLTANLIIDTPRKIVFGITALATDIRYQEWWGADQEFCSQVIVVASHWCHSILEIWLEEKLAWTSTGGTQGEFVGYFEAEARPKATTANAYSKGWSGRWGANASFAGCADIYVSYKVTGNDKKATSPFSSSIPSRVTVRGQGALVYDPRRDTTVGGAGPMRAADQATWAYSYDGGEPGRNNALALLFYLIGWREGGKLMVGRGVPIDRIDLDSFMTAANLCDEQVLRADDTEEPRYRCDGMFSEGDDPKQVIESLEVSMNGKLRDRGGKLALQIFHNALGAPVIDFDDDDVIGPYTWEPGASIEQRKNVVRGRYTDASDASLYQLVDYPEVKLTSLDGIDRIEPLDHPLVQSPSQAQRLSKQRLQRSQYSGTFSADFNAKGWAVSDGDIVRLRFAALGFDYKLFQVAEGTVQVSGIAPLVLIEEHESIYAWDADERPAVVAASPGTYNPLLDPLLAGIGDVTDLAELALYPDGTVRDGKVDTAAIVPGAVTTEIVGFDAVTERYFTQLASPITLTNATLVSVLTLTINKAVDESDIDLDYSLRVSSSDDIRGTMYIYRDATLIDSFSPYANGAGGTFRMVVPMSFTDSGVPAGTYVYSMSFYRNGGASVVTAERGSNIRSKEIKR